MGPILHLYFTKKPLDPEISEGAKTLSEGRAGRNELDEFHGVHVLETQRKKGVKLWGSHRKTPRKNGDFSSDDDFDGWP